MISNLTTAVIRLLIRFYQRVLGPILKFTAGPAAGCRFSPSCSHYFLESVETHGPLLGSWLGICRILRCHPWGGSGHDPVPSPATQRPRKNDCACHHHTTTF
jgi:putative membrane protein insertion efficiency factor